MKYTTACRILRLTKMASTLSEEELANLLPTKEEAGESSTARGFGHLFHGPVTSRRYGAARTVADATGQRTPFLNKHPMTGDFLTSMGGGVVGGLGGAAAGSVAGRLAGGRAGSDTGALIGALGGGSIGMILAKILSTRSRAKGVERIRDGAETRQVNRDIDPEVSLPGWLQYGTGNYDRGVADAHTVFRGGKVKRVRDGDRYFRTLHALGAVAGNTHPAVGAGMNVANIGGSIFRKMKARETLESPENAS